MPNTRDILLPKWDGSKWVETIRPDGNKLVEVVDTAARLALPASQVNVGDIVREVGVKGTIIVSGAGTASANGTYTEDGRLNGYMRFRKVVGSSANPAIVFDSGGYGCWVLVDSENAFSILYFDQNYSATTDPTYGTDFYPITGASPAPALAWGVTPVAAGETSLVADVGNLGVANGWVTMAKPIVIKIGYSDEGAGQTLSAGSWTKIIFNAVVSGGEYVDLPNGLITPPAGRGIVSCYVSLAPHATSYMRALNAVWINGDEYDGQSVRLSDGLVVPKSVYSYPEYAKESSALLYSPDGTTTIEARAWVQSSTTVMKYYKSGTRLSVLWFPFSY